jgi:hypothetical protein
MILAWARLVAHSVGVAAIAAAAQVGIAHALGIVRWNGVHDVGGDTTAWTHLLTWVAFAYAVAVVAGALIGRRAVRRPHRADGLGARVVATLAAALGAGAGVAVAWLPAREVRAPLGVNPGLVVAIAATAGIVAGVVIALAALSSPPIAAGFRATVAWVWLLGIGSAAAGLASHEAYPAPRLAMLDAPSLVAASWWSGSALMIAVAALLGLGVAGFARWAGAHRLSVALSGLAGPAAVALAYLVAGPGEGPAQANPYRAALTATAAGLLASTLVALPGRRSDRAESAVPSASAQAAGEPASARSTAAEAPVSDLPAEPRWPADGFDPTATGTGARPPVDAYEPAAVSRPAYSSVPASAAAAGAGTVYTSESRPKPSIGRPPRGYEEYSEWLKDLSGATGSGANGDPH